MKIQEALKKNKLIRRNCWDEDEYLTVNEDGVVSDAFGDYFLTKEDIMADDWESTVKRYDVSCLFPFLKDGYVAMDSSGVWMWYATKPTANEEFETWMGCDVTISLSYSFNLLPFDGSWEKSLQKVKK